jgi:hypothetical protein
MMIRKQAMLELLVEAGAMRADEMASQRKLSLEQLHKKVVTLTTTAEARGGELPILSRSNVPGRPRSAATRYSGSGNALQRPCSAAAPSSQRTALNTSKQQRPVFVASSDRGRCSAQMRFFVDKGTGRAYVNYNTLAPQQHAVRVLREDARNSVLPRSALALQTELADPLTVKEVLKRAQDEMDLLNIHGKPAKRKGECHPKRQSNLFSRTFNTFGGGLRGRPQVRVSHLDKVGLSKRLTIHLAAESEELGSALKAEIDTLMTKFSLAVKQLKTDPDRRAMIRAAKVAIGINRDLDQSLSAEEIGMVLAEWGFDENDAALFLVCFDQDGSGSITMNEFLGKVYEILHERSLTPSLVNQKLLMMLGLISKTTELVEIVSEDGFSAKLTHGELNRLQSVTRLLDVSSDGLFELVHHFARSIDRLRAKDNVSRTGIRLKSVKGSLGMEQVRRDPPPSPFLYSTVYSTGGLAAPPSCGEEWRSATRCAVAYLHLRSVRTVAVASSSCCGTALHLHFMACSSTSTSLPKCCKLNGN